MDVKVKELRLKANLSVDDMAKTLDVTPEEFIEWENDDAILSDEGLEYFASCFGLTVEEFLAFTPTPNCKTILEYAMIMELRKMDYYKQHNAFEYARFLNSKEYNSDEDIL